MTAAPTMLAMDRLDETEELVLSQSTSQCARCLCCQTTNWIVVEQDHNLLVGSKNNEVS